jgi:predicted transcriptional regulator
MKKIVFKRSMLACMAVVLLFAAYPVPSAYAAGKQDQNPPPVQGELSNEGLEKIWSRELKAYERLGRLFENSDQVIEKTQNLIDRAKENGKDVTAVQAALDAFEAAVKDAHPIYESAKGIINSHKGFDDNGKVIDPELAKETVREMGDKLKEIKGALNGALRSLHEAIKAFRQSNRPANSPNDPGR